MCTLAHPAPFKLSSLWRMNSCENLCINLGSGFTFHVDGFGPKHCWMLQVETYHSNRGKSRQDFLTHYIDFCWEAARLDQWPQNVVLFSPNYLSGFTGNGCLVAEDKNAALQPHASLLEPCHFRPLQSPLETLRKRWDRICESTSLSDRQLSAHLWFMGLLCGVEAFSEATFRSNTDKKL